MNFALDVAALNDSYSLLVAGPDRRREGAFSWTERLCEYRGWRDLAGELEEALAATETRTDAPLVSNQYGVIFGLAYYGAGERAHLTVDDLRFRDLNGLFVFSGPDLPSEILFVARAGTTLPSSLIAHYQVAQFVIRQPRRAVGCAPIQYDVHRLRRR